MEVVAAGENGLTVPLHDEVVLAFLREGDRFALPFAMPHLGVGIWHCENAQTRWVLWCETGRLW
jgi:hypothetical protein